MLDLRHFRQHAHNRAAAKVRHTASRFPDEVIQHRARSFEVSNDAVDQRRDHCDVARFATLHLVRFIADRDNLARHLVDCNHRRFVDNHTTPAHGDDRACRTHVNRHRIGNEVLYGVEAEESFGFTDERHKE